MLQHQEDVYKRQQFVKRLNHSAEFPIDLYRSTNAEHTNFLFTARTLFRLGPQGLSDYEQKRVRNEICASDKIYRLPANIALPQNLMPGSMGVYQLDDQIVSVADTALAGERFDAVLRKLSKEGPAIKAAWAKYYAVAMTKNLENIHAADVIWGNISPRNFYVRPDGKLHAYDFSEASSPVGAPALQLAKDAEFDNFVKTGLYEMYRLLFPNRNDAYTEYTNLMATRAIAVVAGNAAAILAARAAVRTTAWTQILVVDELVAALPNAHNAGNNILLNGLNGYVNAVAFLDNPVNIPYLSGPTVLNPITKAQHQSAADRANLIVLDPAAAAHIFAAPGLVFPPNIELLAPPAVAVPRFCTGWTGIE